MAALTGVGGRKVVTVGLAVLGAWGFAGSTQHVLRLAEAHGQTGWLAWNVAGTVELLAILAGWEIQTRARAGERSWFPKVLLGACVLFVIAANLAMAQPTVWGYVVAVVPPACFFGAAGLIETRQVAQPVAESVAAKPARKAPPARPATPPAAEPASVSGERQAATPAPGLSMVARQPERQAPAAGARQAAAADALAWRGRTGQWPTASELQALGHKARTVTRALQDVKDQQAA